MAFSLNNSNSFFSSAAPVTGYPFSMAGWFRVPNVAELLSLTGLVSFSTGARCDVMFAGDGGNEALAKTVNGSSGSAISTSIMVPGQWHHLTAVFASDIERKIYLDGGNVGVNTAVIAVGSLDFYYFGNINSATMVEMAEISLVGIALDAQQAAALAKGFPMLTLAGSRNLIANQDCIRNANHPGLGLPLTMAGGAMIVDHPRMSFVNGGRSLAMPVRVKGPMQIKQAQTRSLSASVGQMSIAGVLSTNSILPGEVIS